MPFPLIAMGAMSIAPYIIGAIQQHMAQGKMEEQQKKLQEFQKLQSDFQAKSTNYNSLVGAQQQLLRVPAPLKKADGLSDRQVLKRMLSGVVDEKKDGVTADQVAESLLASTKGEAGSVPPEKLREIGKRLQDKVDKLPSDDAEQLDYQIDRLFGYDTKIVKTKGQKDGTSVGEARASVVELAENLNQMLDNAGKIGALRRDIDKTVAKNPEVASGMAGYAGSLSTALPGFMPGGMSMPFPMAGGMPITSAMPMAASMGMGGIAPIAGGFGMGGMDMALAGMASTPLMSGPEAMMFNAIQDPMQKQLFMAQLMLQRQQLMMQFLSNVSKMLFETSRSIVQNIR